MKPIDVKVDTYIDFDVEKNDKYSEFKAGDHVWISKYKNIFAKRYTPYWWKDFLVKNAWNTVLWMHVIEDLKGESNFYPRNIL